MSHEWNGFLNGGACYCVFPHKYGRFYFSASLYCSYSSIWPRPFYSVLYILSPPFLPLYLLSFSLSLRLYISTLSPPVCFSLSLSLSFPLSLSLSPPIYLYPLPSRLLLPPSLYILSSSPSLSAYISPPSTLPSTSPSLSSSFLLFSLSLISPPSTLPLCISSPPILSPYLSPPSPPSVCISLRLFISCPPPPLSLSAYNLHPIPSRPLLPPSLSLLLSLSAYLHPLLPLSSPFLIKPNSHNFRYINMSDVTI